MAAHHQQTLRQLKILTVGAGVAGNALALWLSKLGHKVTVIERHPCLRVNGLQLDLRGNGIKVMRRMGLETAVRAKCVPEEGIALVDSAGTRRAFFATNKTGKGAQSMSSEFEIMRKDLCTILHDAAKRNGAKYAFGVSVDKFTDLEGGGTEVTLTDGKVERFDLVVGCDGQSSRVRRLMLALAHDGGASTGTNTTTDEDHLKDTELISMGERMAYFTIPRPQGENESKYIATIYMMPEKRFVLTRRHNKDEMQVYLKCDATGTPADPLAGVKRGDVRREKEAFATLFEHGGWQTDELVQALRDGGDDFYCQYSGLVRMDRWSRGSVTLVGDAGYCCPPDGFGTSVAMVGAYILAGEIQKATMTSTTKSAAGTPGADVILTALNSYESTFQPYIKQVQKGYSPDPSLFDKIPWTPFTLGIFTRLAGVVAFLGIDRIAARLMPSESVGGWKLPEYQEMDSLVEA